MPHLFRSAVLFSGLLLASAAYAQTTIDLTTSTGQCTYSTPGAVTVNSADGHLRASQSGTLTGTGCPTGSSNPPVNFGPASPLNLTTSMPLASNTSGESATFTFQPVNATQCTGSISPSVGTAFSTTFCGTATACNAPQSVTATFPANVSTTTNATYTVSVSCTGLGSASPVVAPSLQTVPQVTVLPTGTSGGGSCPTIASSTPGITNFTQLTGTQSVYYYGALGGYKSVDATSFAAVYQSVWPGNYGLIAQPNLPNNKYMSMAFTVPANYMTAPNAPNPLYGEYTVGETGVSAPITMTISTSCGDFSNPATNPTSTVGPNCYRSLANADGILFWSKNTSSTCILSNNTTYYFNIINADTTSVTAGGGGTASSSKNSKCSAGTCTDPIQNGPGTWSGYTPN